MTTPLTQKDSQDAATQQIAREAAKQLLTYRINDFSEEIDREHARRIILSAIERATAPLQKQLANIAKINTETNANLAEVIQSRSAQPQPSKQSIEDRLWSIIVEKTGDMELADRVTKSGKDTPSNFEILRPEPLHSEPRCQQQECVEAIVKWVVEDMKACNPQMTRYDDHCLRKEVSFQVNAALAAEREKADNLFKVARKHCVENNQLKQDGRDADNIIAQLTEQLAAERENAEQWRIVASTAGKEADLRCRELAIARTELAAERQRREHAEKRKGVADLQFTISELHEQLMPALAAIEKHNKRTERWPEEKITIDLSALHEHDAKVWEPLVKALQFELHKAKLDEIESAHGRFDQLSRSTGYRTGIEYALAKVKEQ